MLKKGGKLALRAGEPRAAELCAAILAEAQAHRPHQDDDMILVVARYHGV